MRVLIAIVVVMYLPRSIKLSSLIYQNMKFSKVRPILKPLGHRGNCDIKAIKEI